MCAALWITRLSNRRPSWDERYVFLERLSDGIGVHGPRLVELGKECEAGEPGLPVHVSGVGWCDARGSEGSGWLKHKRPVAGGGSRWLISTSGM